MSKQFKNRMKVIGRRIADARLSKGLTQQELADEIGVHVKTIHNFESGTGSSIYTTFKIESFLEIKNLFV